MWFYNRMDLLEPLMERQRLDEKRRENRNRRRVVAEEDDDDDEEVCPRGGEGGVNKVCCGISFKP